MDPAIKFRPLHHFGDAGEAVTKNASLQKEELAFFVNVCVRLMRRTEP